MMELATTQLWNSSHKEELSAVFGEDRLFILVDREDGRLNIHETEINSLMVQQST